ncbi:uncharacterized protein [Dermacentor andersoni]|uniref:uncharacterized protein n=1 Tax=Dermacentor andersoni TaxID=34620 RepID=UPI003B3AF777
MVQRSVTRRAASAELRVVVSVKTVVNVSYSRSTTHLHVGSISSIDNTQPSTSRAGMVEASSILEYGARNTTGTGGRGQQELCGVSGNASSRRDALRGQDHQHTGDTALICEALDESSVKLSKFVERCRIRNAKKHKYESCGKLFHQAGHPDFHRRAHRDEKCYKCQLCEKSFRRSWSLDVHMRTHTSEKPYTCETCGRSFRCSHHLHEHKRTHTDEKPYTCQTCGLSFRRSQNLDVHMRTHTGEKPYTCETCGRSFRRSQHLDGHMRTHTDEKPYTCETCGQSFRRSRHLDVHMRAHTDEKPYTCEACGQSVYVHMREHTGEEPYTCEVCGKSYMRMTDLHRHQHTHMDERPHRRLSEVDGITHTIYADDVTTSCNGGGDGRLEAVLQEAIDITAKYRKPTGLQCSPRKSELLLYGPRRRRTKLKGWKPVEDVDITVQTSEGGVIPRVASLQVLGMTLESNGSDNLTVSKKTHNAIRLIRIVAEDNVVRLVLFFVMSFYLRDGHAQLAKIREGQAPHNDQEDHKESPQPPQEHKLGETGMLLEPERGKSESCAVSVAMFRADGMPYTGAPRNTDDTVHICKSCHQSSVKMSKFVERCRNRTGKKHKCETCGKQFHRADHLTEHYRTHTDERPYKCKTCDKSFGQSHLDNLNISARMPTREITNAKYVIHHSKANII